MTYQTEHPHSAVTGQSKDGGAADAPIDGNPAHVIVIGNEKGGSGKSTTAMHLIVSLLRDGFSVASIDLDARQGTLSRYFENRKNTIEKRGIDLPLPDHFAVRLTEGMTQEQMAENFYQMMVQLQQSHDYIVMDTPGSDTPLSRVGHSFADSLITPMNDSFVDLDLLARVDGDNLKILGPSLYSEMVWEQKKQKAQRNGGSIDWIVMRNRLSTIDARNKRDIEKLLSQLSKRLAFRLAPGFGERVIFREMFLQGLTLLDLRDVGSAWRLNLSHVAARQEVRGLMQTVNLPPRTPKQQA